MRSTAKKQTVYYHATSLDNAYNIILSGKLRCAPIHKTEIAVHERAGIRTSGWYVSLARSLSSYFIRDFSTDKCVLLIDVAHIKGRFRLAPVNHMVHEGASRKLSEYEERIISSSDTLDVSTAVVGCLFRTEEDNKTVSIPKSLFAVIENFALYYVKQRSVVPYPLNSDMHSVSPYDVYPNMRGTNWRNTRDYYFLAGNAAEARFSDVLRLCESILKIDQARLAHPDYSDVIYYYVNDRALQSKSSPLDVIRELAAKWFQLLLGRVSSFCNTIRSRFGSDVRNAKTNKTCLFRSLANDVGYVIEKLALYVKDLKSNPVLRGAVSERRLRDIIAKLKLIDSIYIHVNKFIIAANPTKGSKIALWRDGVSSKNPYGADSSVATLLRRIQSIVSKSEAPDLFKQNLYRVVVVTMEAL